MVAEMKELFTKMDADGNGALNMTEFCRQAQDVYVKSYLASMALDIPDATMLFRILRDTAGTDELPIDEFVKRIARMIKQVCLSNCSSTPACALASLLTAIKQFKSHLTLLRTQRARLVWPRAPILTLTA